MTNDAESPTSTMQGKIVAVCRKAEPGLPKLAVDSISLLADWGVEGDYHAGKFVRHRYLAKKDPQQPNLRQVLIVDSATYTTLAQAGIQLERGMLGENIAVEGIPIMQLPIGSYLTIGTARLEVTEIRVPCKQLNGIDTHLLKAVTNQQAGKTNYTAGILTRVLQSGVVYPGDTVEVAVDLLHLPTR